MNMCLYIYLFLMTFLLPSGNFESLIPKRGENYGPYEFNLTYYGLCPGVKLQKTQAVAYFEEEAPEKYIAVTNISYVNNVRIENLKVLMYKGQDESTVFWKYIVKKPCEHPVCGPILHKTYGTDHSCNVKEGNYIIKMRIHELIPASFLGDQFFYGEFSYKVTIMAKSYTLICVITKCLFTKKQ